MRKKPKGSPRRERGAAANSRPPKLLVVGLEVTIVYEYIYIYIYINIYIYISLGFPGFQDSDCCLIIFLTGYFLVWFSVLNST